MAQICISETSLLSLSLSIENPSEQFKIGCKKTRVKAITGSVGNLIHAITQMIINMEINVYIEEIFESNY